ncbi:MAG: hypothetical protein B6240_14790 [Desulfobacteraceae bacterium 4572_87]|nr:MAG: hypothetical protein B6240_14790 [Desulfobacteraceae bacterium 4572_87]
MKCKECKIEITEYRIVGVCMVHDQADQDEYFNKGLDVFPLRVSAGFKALKMVECPNCGEVRFYSLKSGKTDDMNQIPNTDNMEALTNVRKS